MALLNRVRDLWQYYSPHKPQRREKPYSCTVPSIPRHAKKCRTTQSATPSRAGLKRHEPYIQAWNSRIASPRSDIDATILPPSPSTSALQLHEEMEGDTLTPQSPLSPDEDEFGSPDEEWDANEDTIVVDDGRYMEQSKKIDLGAELSRRTKQARELRDTGWSEDAVFLFQKLAMRGMEPLLPDDWFVDFAALPGDLFTNNIDKAFIRPVHGSYYRAQRALRNLIDLGGRVRDAWHTRAPVRTPAYQINRFIEQYTAWAMKDGDVHTNWAELPLFETIAFPRHVKTSVAERQLIGNLGSLHDRWANTLQTEPGEDRMSSTRPDVPTLYGVTVSHTILAFASYAPPTEENEVPHLRMLGVFDFGKDGFDVWNALAIAIFIVHCRNRMIQLQEFLPPPNPPVEEDPDL